MTIEFVASGLLGIVLGMCFRVLAMVPVTLLSIVVAAAISIFSGFSGLTMLGSIVITTLALQVGYVCGSFAASLKDEPALEASSATHATGPLGLPTK